MTITDLTVVAAGKSIELGPGDVLEIQVSFKYIASQPADVVLWASLGIGIGRDIESFKNILLDTTLTTKTWTGETQIQIPITGKTDGTYWMKVEIDGEEVTIQDAVIISGMPSTGFGQIGDMIGMMVTMMIVMMMMNMMKDPLGTIETAGRAVKGVSDIYVKVKGVPAATKQAYTAGKEGW